MTPDTFRHSPEILPGQRLRLEKIHGRHAAALHASVRRSLSELEHVSWGQRFWDEEATRRHCESTREWILSEGEGVSYLAFEYDTDTYVGCVDLHSVDFGVPRCQIGFVGCSRQRGRGLMREAALTLMDWVWRQGMVRVEVWCDVRNTRALAFAESLGLRREGLMRQVERDGHGRLCDHHLLARLVTDPLPTMPAQAARVAAV
ncbi:MAG: hypothetical protein RLZZ592_974 [Pseudomonadota bacterium]|jgi:RimJ/RimL family protein N-acetyltransferase